MIKLLEYLKNELNDMDSRRLYTIEVLENAIMQLEELNNRKCENCKHWNLNTKIDGNSKCNKLFNFRSYYDFYCNKYALNKKDK